MCRVRGEYFADGGVAVDFQHLLIIEDWNGNAFKLII